MRRIETIEKNGMVTTWLYDDGIMNFTPLKIVSETRYYKEMWYLLIGFIITECVAFGVAMMARYIYVHYLYSLYLL